jgi:hypothetical protein
MKSICIIGAGISGLITLLLLNEAGANLSAITIVDPFFDGGDLARKWTSVLSNTPWSKTLAAITKYCPSLAVRSSNDPSAGTALVEIAHFIRSACTPLLEKVTCVQGLALNSNYSTETNEWSTRVTTHGNEVILRSHKLILAPGGEPKTLNLAIPSIPLEIALDPLRLKHYIQPSNTVLVFGTMHSGTIAIRNLASLGAKVRAFYRSPKPFYWDRDGDYDGIKGEAAEIADKIVAGTIPATLISTSDTTDVIRFSRDATWAVYAIGFLPRTIQLSINGQEHSSSHYTYNTGALTAPSAWGFGLAYPNRAPDGVHWDVGVAPFFEHINLQISTILSDKVE